MGWGCCARSMPRPGWTRRPGPVWAALAVVVGVAAGLECRQAAEVARSACEAVLPRGGVCRAAVDNVSHAILAGLVWLCVSLITPPGDKPLPVGLSPSTSRELIAAFTVGSWLDLDHFLAAGSLRLQDATRLSHRPFGHALLAAGCLGALAALLTRQRRKGVLVATAILSHQLRDALRRGMWLFPLGSTAPLPFPVYLVCLFSLPLLVAPLAGPPKREWTWRTEHAKTIQDSHWAMV